MEDLIIRQTNKSPEIKFLADGRLSITGVSILENAHEFYKKPIAWLKEYILVPAQETVLDINLDFFNTSSQVHLFEIISLMSDLQKMGYKVVINWYYSDEEFRDLGKDISDLIGIDFNFISVE